MAAQEATAVPAVASSITAIDCIVVENDQFYNSDKQVSKSDTPSWKGVLKSLRAIEQRSEVYFESIQSSGTGTRGTPVFALSLPFFVRPTVGIVCGNGKDGSLSQTQEAIKDSCSSY